MGKRYVFSAVALIFTIACSGPVKVARVGSEKLDIDDFRMYVSNHPSDSSLPAQQQLDGLVDEVVAAQMAAKVGMDKERSFQLGLRVYERDSLASEYLKSHYEKELAVDNMMLHSIYAQMGEKRKLRHILVKTEKEATRAREEIGKGKDFSRIAAEISTDGSAQNGGELGWLNATQLDPTFVEKTFDLKEGELSNPFQTRFGWHVVECEGVEHADMSGFEKEKDKIKLMVQRQKAGELKRKAAEEAGKTVKVEKFPAVFEGDYDLEASDEDFGVVVAKVGGTSYNLAELKSFMGGYFQSKGSSHVMGPKAKEEFLSVMLESAVLAERARAEGLDKKPDFKAGVRAYSRSTLSAALKQKTVAEGKIPPADLAAWYEKKPKELQGGEELHLFFLISSDESSARAARKSSESGKPFQEVVRKYSTDPTAQENGGDAGWVSVKALESSLPKEVAGALASSTPGALAGPFNTEFGWQLFKVEGKRASSFPPLKGNEAAIEEAYRRFCGEQIWQKQLDAWKKELKIKLYPENIPGEKK